MARDIRVKRPAAMHFLTGQIAELEQRREFLYARMEQDMAEAQGVEELLAELEQVRSAC